MPDVFVSYKRENEGKVAKLVAALRSHGLDTWWDREISPGAPWEATIESQLAAAKAVIVCWSKAAVASDNVKSEARLARNQGHLIQAFLEPCEPPLFFGERQGVDLANWRGKVDDPRVAALADAARAAADGRTAELPPTAAAASWTSRRAVLAGVLLLMLTIVAGWFGFKFEAPSGPTTVAVLPFRAMSAEDSNLGEAIAEDTRTAIGHNPNLRVLGRSAVTALAQQGLTPQEIRKRVGADYLLDGSIQRDGQSLRIRVSLVRAKDAAQVWADQLGGKVDDIFAFQGRIAREVEGRIRGRLAPNEGKRAENITTSGEVYSIYADARARSWRRQPDVMEEALPLLKQAVAKDPNFAPAWSELGVVTNFVGGREGKSPDQVRDEAAGYIRRALSLAPNLGVAHAALAMVQYSPPTLMGEYQKAIELDPNNAEVWNWLGGAQGDRNKIPESIEDLRRANEIDPLWASPIGNLVGSLTEVGDDKGIAELEARVRRTGDALLQAKFAYWLAQARGHLGEAARLALVARSKLPLGKSYFESRSRRTFVQLGFIDEGLKMIGRDPHLGDLYRGIAPPAGLLRSVYRRPIEFWEDEETPAVLARLFSKQGRIKEFVGWYRAAFKTPEEFYNFSPSGGKGDFRSFAPNTATLLRADGESADADEILRLDDNLISSLLKNGPAHGGLSINLAQLRGAQGRDDEAVRLIGQALGRGYLPDRQYESIDIADEPCFAKLVGRADFQALRKHILARIEEERRIAAPAVAAASFENAS